MARPWLSAALCLTCTVASAAAGTGLASPASSARIFFSGHSLLDNPMPDFVAEIAQSQGQELEWNQQNVEGSPIRLRTWGDGNWAGYRQGKNRVGHGLEVIQELRSPRTLSPGARYDTLIITERHDLIGSVQWEDSVGFLRHFHDRIIEGNPQGRTYLYHTWLDLDKANPAPWIDYEKKALVAWECVASRVNLSLQAEGRSDRVVPLPGGAALVDLVERMNAGQVRGITGSTPQKLDALFRDDVHLTPLGAYYLAAVHYASVYRRSPVGAAGPPGAHPDTVRDLQTIAWNFTRAYYEQPAPGTRTMAECREHIAQDVCPGFWSLLGEPGKASDCRNLFGNASSFGNPFVWFHPTLPGGDSPVPGWLFVLACLGAAGLCWRASARGLRGLWSFAGISLLLLASMKQLELQSWLLDILRELAREQGLYTVRRLHLLALAGGVLFIGTVGTAGLGLLHRRALKQCAGALAGFALLTAALAMRAAPLHAIPAVNALLELVAVLLIGLAAWRASWSRVGRSV